MTEYVYKMLRQDNTAPYSRYAYPLPTDDTPGEWTPALSGLRVCKVGYHVSRTPREVIRHRETNVYLAEYRGEMIDGGEKGVCGSVRLVRQVMGPREWILFAADCAEHVLSVFEERYPEDDRPRLAIKAARDYVNGTITRDAADAAAYAAARAAAHAAAYAAANAASYAAADAARTADASERQWQDERLAWYLTGEAFEREEN